MELREIETAQYRVHMDTRCGRSSGVDGETGKDRDLADDTLPVNHRLLEEFGSIETSFRATNRPFAGPRGQQRFKAA
jgi:hypothetical protein